MKEESEGLREWMMWVLEMIKRRGLDDNSWCDRRLWHVGCKRWPVQAVEVNKKGVPPIVPRWFFLVVSLLDKNLNVYKYLLIKDMFVNH